MVSDDTRKVWFQLVNSTGGSYKGSKFDTVTIPSSADVVAFRKRVKAERVHTLADVDAGNLIVYTSIAAFSADQAPLEPDFTLDLQMGASMCTALVVVVPDVHASATTMATDQRPSTGWSFFSDLFRGKVLKSPQNLLMTVAFWRANPWISVGTVMAIVCWIASIGWFFTVNLEAAFAALATGLLSASSGLIGYMRLPRRQ
jgi:hypothetical protein